MRLLGLSAPAAAAGAGATGARVVDSSLSIDHSSNGTLRNEPRVREMAALVLHAHGRTAEAVDSLTALHREDPRRLETLTELVRLVGQEEPARARAWVEAGRRLIEAAELVAHTYERDRWVPHGALTRPAVEGFETAVKALGRASAPDAPTGGAGRPG